MLRTLAFLALNGKNEEDGKSLAGTRSPDSCSDAADRENKLPEEHHSASSHSIGVEFKVTSEIPNFIST